MGANFDCGQQTFRDSTERPDFPREKRFGLIVAVTLGMYVSARLKLDGKHILTRRSVRVTALILKSLPWPYVARYLNGIDATHLFAIFCSSSIRLPTLAPQSFKSHGADPIVLEPRPALRRIG